MCKIHFLWKIKIDFQVENQTSFKRGVTKIQIFITGHCITQGHDYYDSLKHSMSIMGKVILN